MNPAAEPRPNRDLAIMRDGTARAVADFADGELLVASQRGEVARIQHFTSVRRLAHGAARNTDPITSHLAAARVTQSGTRADHVTRIVRAVREHPGHTSAELANLTGLERHEAARRTADAEHQRLIRKGEPRTCTVGGKAAVTWFPNLTQSQAECPQGTA